MTTLHVSGSLSAHHQEFWTVHRLWYIICSFGDRMLPGVGWHAVPSYSWYQSRYTAQNSWWWAERLPETCRVVIPIKLEFSASLGFIHFNLLRCTAMRTYNMKSTLAKTGLMGNMELGYCGPFSKLSRYNHVLPSFTKHTASNYSDIKTTRKPDWGPKNDFMRHQKLACEKKNLGPIKIVKTTDIFKFQTHGHYQITGLARWLQTENRS
jgi:hypothetical protein